MSRWRGSPLRSRSRSVGMRLGRAACIPASLRFLRESRYRGMVISDRLITLWLLAGVNQVQTYTLQPTVLELQRLGGTIRKVDNPTRDHRSPIIDSDHYGLSVT